ncbi:MAG TPA: hypothetical protein VGB85_26610 [Nannocystis sp.]
MRARWGCLLCIVLACGGSGSVDPADATAEDLHGRWVRLLPEGDQRVFSFQERGSFHPQLVDATDVFAIYDVTETAQYPNMFGTYRVEAGQIVQTAVWSRDETLGGGEFRNDLLSLQTGAQLVIEGGDGMPSTYDHVDTCEVPRSIDGWRHLSLAPSLWNSYGGVGRIFTTVAVDPAGAIVATAFNAVARYDGECIPEVTSEDSLGDSSVHRAPDGVHVITGRHQGLDAVPATYTRLLPGPFRLDSRPLPIDGREVLDATDLGGKIGILLRPAGGGYALVRDDGASFIQAPLTGIGPQFIAAELLDGGNGRAVIVGTDYPAGELRLALAEETDAGFVTSEVPIPTFASYVAAAAEGDDLYIVYAAAIDPGAARPQLLHLATRRAGTWTTTPLLIGALPQVVARDGVAHIVSLVVDPLEITAHYTRVDAGGVASWRAGGAGTGGQPVPVPAIDLTSDDTVILGVQGSLHLRGRDERDDRMVPVSVTIEGSGRVLSSDGTIDCTQSCTVMAEVGRRLLVTATATSGGVPFVACPVAVGAFDPAVPEVCNLDVRIDDGLHPLVVTATFP